MRFRVGGKFQKGVAFHRTIDPLASDRTGYDRDLPPPRSTKLKRGQGTGGGKKEMGVGEAGDWVVGGKWDEISRESASVRNRSWWWGYIIMKSVFA